MKKESAPKENGELSLVLLQNETTIDLENSSSSMKSSILYSSAKFEEEILNPSMQPIIKVMNLKKKFPNSQKPALENINLAIFEKEIFCLLGHNGAGKTTFMNILSGFISQSKGSLLCKYFCEEFIFI